MTTGVTSDVASNEEAAGGFSDDRLEARAAWKYAIIAALGAWAILTATTRAIPIVWDEGQYLQRADLIIAWARQALDVGGAEGGLRAFSAAAIRRHWLFINYSEGHPAWFAIPIALTKGLLSGLLDPLTAARLGPITVFSLACGAVAYRLRKRDGRIAAVIAPVALLTIPRLFSEAHFATLDGQLTAWWLMLWVADSSAPSARSTARVGILLGLTAATKFTGWLAWIPITISRLFARDSSRRRELLVLPLIALTIFYVVNPPLWHDPIAGLRTHVRRSVQRADVFDLPIMFLGERYSMQRSLPWYNTAAWLLFVTPVPLLALGLAGLRRIGPRASAQSDPSVTRVATGIKAWREPQSLPLLLHWATPMIVRALPGAPPHGGIRLFLPAFGFWCVFAGIGAQRIWDSARWQRGAWPRRAIGAGLAAALVATAVNLTRYFPQTLSHYSLLVGGLRGATRLGMEATYWWDALDDDVLAWINQHTDPTSVVAFSSTSRANLLLLREWGRLRAHAVEAGEANVTDFTWYVVQNRPDMFRPVDRALVLAGSPVYTKYAGHHTTNVPADLDVPLLMIFSYSQFKNALAAGAMLPSPVPARTPPLTSP